MQVTYLLDEHMNPAVLDTLHRIEPAIRSKLVGWDDDVPPKQTPDPALLTFAELEQMAIVTFDKTTMPGHIADHLAAGRHTWGVFIFPHGDRLSPGRIAHELVMVWGTSTLEEWVDRVEYLPY
jgi:hypothetical protein